MGNFPFRNGRIFVVVHLLVHAGAVFQDDVFLRPFILVVLDALTDPCGIVSGGRKRRHAAGYHGKHQDGFEQHHPSPSRLRRS